MIHVYGVMEYTPLIGRLELFGKTPELFWHHNLALVGQRLLHRKITSEEILKGQLRLFRFGTILPFSINTFFPNGEEASNFLETNYDRFKHFLQLIEGLSEYQLIFDVAEEKVLTPKSKDSAGHSYFMGKYKAYYKDLKINEVASKVIDELNRKLQTLSPSYQKYVHTNTEFNVTVPTPLKSLFEETVIEIMTRFESVTLKLNGPWPPYRYITSLT